VGTYSDKSEDKDEREEEVRFKDDEVLPEQRHKIISGKSEDIEEEEEEELPE
jgi:hypothetical protein